MLEIFIDLSAAFDTFSHFNLLQKLNSRGIYEVANDPLKSYLTNGVRQVSVNGTDMEQVNLRVPHESILGSLLFLLYINGLKF